MTPHNHREYVEGCFRCELSRDEVDDERVRAAAEARDRLLSYDRPMSVADTQRAVEELSQTVLRLEAEVDRLRADLDRSLDALAATVAFMEENFPNSPDFRDAPAFVAARATLATHEREPHDG